MKKGDKFIMSKGHASAVLYATLNEMNLISDRELDTFYQDGSNLGGYVTSGPNGVDWSCGSLGHGLGVGVGMALAKPKNCVFVLMSEGELDEGSVWEAIMFVPTKNLGNLIMIIDYNGIQSFDSVENVIELQPLKEKFRAFGWQGLEVSDGNDVNEVQRSLKTLVNIYPYCPKFLICYTVKGFPISYMCNNNDWHYKSPNREQYEQAMGELK